MIFQNFKVCLREYNSRCYAPIYFCNKRHLPFFILQSSIYWWICTVIRYLIKVSVWRQRAWSFYRTLYFILPPYSALLYHSITQYIAAKKGKIQYWKSNPSWRIEMFIWWGWEKCNGDILFTTFFFKDEDFNEWRNSLFLASSQCLLKRHLAKIDVMQCIINLS